MNKHLEQLVLLSKIDQEIDSFEPKIDSITKNLKDAENKINQINIQIGNLELEIEDVKNQKIQNNLHISEFSAKIKELGKKSASVKTEKEANALKIEEDIAKEQLDSANDEIIRLDKILENKELFKKELLEKKAKEEQDIETIRSSIKTQMEALEKERMDVYAKKTKLVADINLKVLSFYEKIRKWAKNTAVVAVKKQACYGCFMKIYDKTYLSVIKGEEIITCPHCGRILYKEQEDKS
ncbi:zinc ribbon domain-containing protein [Campylobacter sp. LH-2024]|uniref:Zinc ribbon domain-containing protein n=1 Tax=Campylobacter molothri TaxID=1032242 RepID=A0ACC5W355_9BACT|nr:MULTISPECIES: zinc ribbon domain-containing protein [unclassified Campylobacter]MBZ7929051.1 zinc ribbon domain-containing protein [Campylobacter sp. RM10542]MBZ7930503.1 zinc ribbon domain-containing protein [Campylobacter sp. W0067]MBZ7931493.1 zinc ribbon domain-containing protein [Campylobacter sp. RM12910]MBZ7933377.1 zinc ribbon domain-containing protein [Campylobacter sp. RM10543]MBZ7937583.1 zinc ribbon domain-containing protein [Campylobacter sp. RM10538]MBZ7941190.1 zinc ribbon d